MSALGGEVDNEKARASNNTSKMGSWYPLNCVDTPDQPQTRVPNLAGNEGGKGSEEDDHLYGYDTDNGIGVTAGFTAPA